MSRIPLRAVATPVDIFAPAATQAGDGGQELMQLAGSLSKFSATLGRYTQYKSEEDRKNAMEEAIQLQREHRFDNIEAYNQLVSDGTVTEGGNPWKLVYLRQLVAQEHVSNAALAIEQDFYNNPPENPDDIVGIRNQVQERLLAATEGLDSFEFQAVAGQVDQFTQQFVSRHQTKREGERVLEADEAMMHSLMSLTSASPETAERLGSAFQADASPDQKRVGETYIQSLQDLANASTSVTPAPRVRSRMVAAIEQMAIRNRDPELASTLISRLTVGGKALSESVDGAWMSGIRTQVDRAIVSDMQLARTQDKMRQDAYMGPVYEMIDSAPGNPFDVPLPNDFPPEALAELQQFQSLVAKRRARSLLSDASSEVLAGTFTSGDRLTLGHALIALQQPSSEALNQLDRLNSATADAEYADETPARTKLALGGLRKDTTTPAPDLLNSLLSMQEAGQVSKKDFELTLNAIINRTPQSIATKATFREGAVKTLFNRVRPSIPDEYDVLQGRSVPDPQRLIQLEQAQVDLRDNLSRLMDTHPDITTEELDAYTEKLIDDMSLDLGGMTRQQQVEHQAAIRASEEFKLFSDRSGTLDPFEMPDGKMTFSFAEGSGSASYFFVGADGSRLRRSGTAPLFTDDPSDFGNPHFLHTLFGKLGMDSSDSSLILNFLKSQTRNYDGEDRQRLFNLISALENAPRNRPKSD